MERSMKGVWIPIELWEDKNLSARNRFLLAMIYEESNQGKEYCCSSNLHFAKFMKCTERTVTTAISELIEKGYITVDSFDGRVRRIRVNVQY